MAPFAALVLLVAPPAVNPPAPPASAGRAGGDPPAFAADVRPLLAKRCVGCHGPDKQRGGLRLDRKADALAGGDSGPAVVPGKGAGSLLVRLAAGADPDRVMPPAGDRLTPAEVATLRAWVDAGADWPDAAAPDRRDRPGDWWSLRPLAKPAVPPLHADDRGRARNPVDHFVLAKLREKGLTPSPQADRRTLIRRLFFDLTGLPPAPEEVDAFAADGSPDAYDKLVDRLLASPHYGERWARHWLDVAHYGDTHGYDKDQPRPNAWPYRDYVIRSLNADKPYGRFVREQVAGDVLYPGTLDGVTALGFLAAGPWDLIGHAEVPETKLDGRAARHQDRDDVVATVMNTFASLTVQCAQCHNHKLDPVPQEDYYRLQAVFSALDRADKPYHADPAAAARHAALTAERRTLVARRDALAAKLAAAGGAELAALDKRIAAADGPSPQYGYHSAIESRQNAVKWAQVDLGRPVALGRVVLWGASDDFAGIGAGFGFPVRYRVEVSDDPAFTANVTVVADRTAGDRPNPGTAAVTLPATGKAGRYVRVTATRLAPRSGDFIFALAELEALDAAGTNLAAGKAVTAADSIEAGPRWGRANLVDGRAPGKAAGRAELTAARAALLERVAGPAAKEAAAVAAEVGRVDVQLRAVAPTGLVYAGTVHHGAGAFRGTGPDGGKPRPVFVLRRGDISAPGKEVTPAAPSGVPGPPSEFDLPAGHAEGDRRAALAGWLADPRNPLTWRSVVNRAWHHHFGRGIVDTPSDFGRGGSAPTHPELLDWLAAEFRDGGQSLKRLHRLIVTSATYRQASAADPARAAVDAQNAYLWRSNRRKLEAEAVRDAALAAAGKLDRTMYGPPFRDYAVTRPEYSPHYDYATYDPADPASHRRTVYRSLVRSKPQPFLAALDCADPSVQVDRRTETLSPLQALALFNNRFMLAMSKHLAARAAAAGGTAEDQSAAAFRLAVGRAPTAEERAALGAHAREHGLAGACRVALNLSEFVFVD